jgi:hypothetical protein
MTAVVLVDRGGRDRPETLRATLAWSFVRDPQSGDERGEKGL